MEKYVINYNTGTKNEVEVDSLKEAKQIAKDGISDTKQPITIEDTAGNLITMSRWYAVQASPEHEAFILLKMETGFFTLWDDELTGF